jgi:hypothetical protein
VDEIPIVRHFIACESLEMSGGGITLHETIHAIVRLEGEVFPCERERLSPFALLTNGRGVHEFSIELTHFELGEERLVHPPWGPIQRDLGPDPTVVHGLPMNLRHLIFDAPGQYAFHLLCDGRIIAEEQLFVR